MAETLTALLLVASSAKGSSLVFWWPPSPQTSPRLARPRPTYNETLVASQYDNAWVASNVADLPLETALLLAHNDQAEDDEAYEWKRPDSYRDRSISFSNSIHSVSRSRPTSRPGTPFNNELHPGSPSESGGYDDLLGFTPEFLANLLRPRDSLCHQKFDLVVDELAFIGHPVSADKDGVWRFKPEKTKAHGRGRDYRNRQSSQHDGISSIQSSASGKEHKGDTELSGSYPLHTFHFVLILDVPDPSSAPPGNVSKYFDVVYEQVAFTFTAILFQEQVLSNFVALECDALTSLREEYIAKGMPFSCFMDEALQSSSIASSMKILFEAIKESSIAYMTVHDHPVELQLPPYLDILLHSNEEDEVDYITLQDDDRETDLWGSNMSVGWRLPAMAPWKGLLLLDAHSIFDLSMDFDGPQISPGDRALAEGLLRFLETASVTIPLSDMASLLDWDLESQVFPTVRWLVYHRKAKVVDVVHPKLKTVFTLPPKFDLPLATLTSDFEKEFADSSVPSLPQILSTISTSASKQSDFFSSVVQSKDLIPLYHDVVVWMLKRDMLITLHLRIRVVATRELKLRVRRSRERARAKRAKTGLRGPHSKHVRQGDGSDRHSRQKTPWLSFFHKGEGERMRRSGSGDSALSELVLKELEENVTGEEEPEEGNDEDDEDDEDDDTYDYESDNEDEEMPRPNEDGEQEEWEEDQENLLWSSRENYIAPTMISDPGRATPLQRRWLYAMSEGKDPLVAKRFEQINQYFDGKRTDDEILHRAEISRRQLREVLHHYDEYLQTFLHPS